MKPAAPLTSTLMSRSYRAWPLRSAGPYADPALDHVEIDDLQPPVRAPTLDLVWRMPESVQRMVPVEIGHDVCFKVQSVVPVAFEDVPVDEALQIMAASLDLKNRNILRHFELDLQVRERLPKQRHGAREFVAFLFG